MKQEQDACKRDTLKTEKAFGNQSYSNWLYMHIYSKEEENTEKTERRKFSKKEEYAPQVEEPYFPDLKGLSSAEPSEFKKCAVEKWQRY